MKRGVAGGSRAGGLVGLGADTMRKAKGKNVFHQKELAAAGSLLPTPICPLALDLGSVRGVKRGTGT
ncbi:hypothetical protein NKT34_30160 [Paenibacillus polysaccharolyticus]|uniref:hypothetical protein n=1 Tax=Paenibacillus polysaccharolyticus TaxID=582692 RepID=UPI00209F53AB|nr:hypothetical protein [Paenibacillus polysaccharolyticus]MCP1137527.1 hypothetical protein [Paenibacillus polysaccharolyticus]